MSLFILKPDAYIKRHEILEKIQCSEMHEFEMGASCVDMWYSDKCNNYILNALYEYFNEGTSIIGISELSLCELLHLSGTKTHPDQCDVGTIRQKYGLGVGYTSGELQVIRNAIHRPKTNIQLQKEMAIYRRLGY